MRPHLLLWLFLLLPPGVVAAEEAGEGPDGALDASGPLMAWRCESGAELQLAELTLETGEILIFLFHEGEEIQMRQVPAASGVRYRSLDADLAVVWHAKGEEGLLYRELPDDATEVLEQGCVPD